MRSILIVEDNEVIIKGLTYLLEKENFHVIICKNVNETMNAIGKQEIHLIVLDIALPDGNGFELCEYIKKYTDIPVIFLTAKDEEQDVVKGLDLGAEDYIIKPFRNRELLSRINNVLKRFNKEDNKIDNVFDYLRSLDVVFPVLHGLYGEDGTIQGLFELLGVPYVGCRVLASSLGMDKVYAKMIFDKVGIENAKYIYIKKVRDKYIYIDNKFNEKELSLQDIALLVETELSLPVFIKPSRSGSSVGINKAHTREEVIKYIEYASGFDNKILIEENIIGREIECAVLGNNEVEASPLGEILPKGEFYSYSAKYVDNSKTIIPDDIDKDISDKIKKTAIKAYKSLDCFGLSRVDFFLEKDTNRIILNEINTMPGFTTISMYPKLWESAGLSYSELLDKLISLALE